MNAELKTHENLDAWRKSIELVQAVYETTKSFPQEELYGLTNQLRRAAVSIPSNVVYPVKYAERELFHGARGAARGSKKEFIQFLYVALGSVSEVETQLVIAKRLDYLDNSDSIEEQIETVRKLILGLIRYLKARDGKG